MFRHASFSMSLAVALAISVSVPAALAQTDISDTHRDHQAVPDAADNPQAQDQNIQPPPAKAEPQSLQDAYPPKYRLPALPYQQPEPIWYPGYPPATGQISPSHQMLATPELGSQPKTPLSGYVSKSEKWNLPLSQGSFPPQQQQLNANRPSTQQNQPQSNFLLQQQAPGCSGSGYQLQPDYASPAPLPQQPLYGYPNQQNPYPENSRRTIRSPKWNPLTIFRGGCF